MYYAIVTTGKEVKQTSTESDSDDMMSRIFLRGPLLNPISFKSASLSFLKANPFILSSAY